MPQLYFTSTQPPGAHRRIPVRSHDRADPRWNPATQRKKRKGEYPQRNASDNENVLKMFMKMKDMESELSRIKAFRRAECKRTIARLRGQTAAQRTTVPVGLPIGRGGGKHAAVRLAARRARPDREPTSAGGAVVSRSPLPLHSRHSQRRSPQVRQDDLPAYPNYTPKRPPAVHQPVDSRSTSLGGVT